MPLTLTGIGTPNSFPPCRKRRSRPCEPLVSSISSCTDSGSCAYSESSAAQMHIRVPDLVDANRGVRSKSTSADEAERLDDIDLMLFAAVEQAVAFVR